MQAVLASREVRFTQLGTKISVSSPGGGGRDEGVVLPNAANTDRFCATSLFDMQERREERRKAALLPRQGRERAE